MKKVYYATLVAVLYMMGFILFLTFRLTVFNDVTQKQAPIISFVDQAITNGKYVYTLDDVCNRICKFSIEGELCDTIKLNSYSASIIFFDEDLRLCRNDYKLDKLFIYDDDGHVIEEYDWDWFLDKDCPIQMMKTSSQITCQYQNRSLFNSTVTISNGDHETQFIVEYFEFHLFCYAVVMVLISVFGTLAVAVIKHFRT